MRIGRTWNWYREERSSAHGSWTGYAGRHEVYQNGVGSLLDNESRQDYGRSCVSSSSEAFEAEAYVRKDRLDTNIDDRDTCEVISGRRSIWRVACVALLFSFIFMIRGFVVCMSGRGGYLCFAAHRFIFLTADN